MGGHRGTLGVRKWVLSGVQAVPGNAAPREPGARGAQPRGSGARSVLSGGLGCPCAWLPARFPWGDIRPAPRPLPTAGDSWTRGRGVGAGKPAQKETPASGEGGGGGGVGGGRLPPLRAGSSERAVRGEEEEGWAGASEGIFLSRLESDAGGSVLPRSLPGDGNLLHFPGAGSPTLPTSPHLPGPFQLPRPPPGWAGPGLRCHPLFGERQPQTPGGRGWRRGLPRSRGSVVQHVRLM